MLTYLATPYTHIEPSVRQHRYEENIRIAHQLVSEGKHIFAPILHNHPLALLGLPTDWPFWERYDSEFLSKSDELYLVTLPGWRTSNGMRHEFELARPCIPIYTLNPHTFFLRSLNYNGVLTWEDVNYLIVD